MSRPGEKDSLCGHCRQVSNNVATADAVVAVVVVVLIVVVVVGIVVDVVYVAIAASTLFPPQIPQEHYISATGGQVYQDQAKKQGFP